MPSRMQGAEHTYRALNICQELKFFIPLIPTTALLLDIITLPKMGKLRLKEVM